MKTRKLLAALFALASGWTLLQNGCGDISYFPGYGLYDPTGTIQSVIDYRQDVMDWSANAWDEYILQ